MRRIQSQKPAVRIHADIAQTLEIGTFEAQSADHVDPLPAPENVDLLRVLPHGKDSTRPRIGQRFVSLPLKSSLFHGLKPEIFL